MLEAIQKNVAWVWRYAAFGLVLAVPGAIVILLGHVKPGIELLVGTMPAAIIGYAPIRSKRRSLLIIGVLFAASVAIGSLLARSPWVAVPGIALVALGSAWLAAHKPFGLLAMSLCLPILGIGFSYSVGTAVGFGLLILIGTLYAWLLSLCFKEYSAPPAPEKNLMTSKQALHYGILLACTAATAAIVGFTTHTDHVGWVVGAALLVMRPSHDLQELRSVGRIVAVITGALAASVLLLTGAPMWIYAVVAPLAIICMAGTHTSRWYITPGFTTFLVIMLLSYGESGTVAHFFRERSFETLAGVGIAYFFGLLIPKVLEWQYVHHRLRSQR